MHDFPDIFSIYNAKNTPTGNRLIFKGSDQWWYVINVMKQEKKSMFLTGR